MRVYKGLNFEEGMRSLMGPTKRRVERELDKLKEGGKVNNFKVKKDKNKVKVYVDMKCDREKTACKQAMQRKLDDISEKTIEEVQEQTEDLYEKL